MPRLETLVIVFILNFFVACSPVNSDAAHELKLNRAFVLNENMIEQLAAGKHDDACDYKQVLPQLLGQIGPRADIYPSENYYYFSFSQAGSLFSGSLRLSSDQRDNGVLDYVCYESYRHWIQAGGEVRVHKQLSAADGVSVERLSELNYRVSYAGSKTHFTLHQLDHIRPSSALLPSDALVGRTLDDSGTAFELVYNAKVNGFYFLLDRQAGVPDTFVRLTANTVISRRTGFVYYHRLSDPRYLLVAVNQAEVLTNSYFDGPFDHLPENDYKDIGFWDYVYKVYPSMVGNHSPGGVVNAEGMIFSIRPYRLYDDVEDLGFIDDCILNKEAEVDRLACMIWGL